MKYFGTRGLIWVGLACFLSALTALPQSINSGTVLGTVIDPSGAVIAGAMVRLQNSVTGYMQSVTTDSSGAFRFNNVPQNNYRLTVDAPGFTAANRNLDVRNAVPITLAIPLTVAAETTSVTVEASGAQVETDPSAHQDVDRNAFLKLPDVRPGRQSQPGHHL